MAKGYRVISPSSDLNVPAYTDMFVDDNTMRHNDNKFNISPLHLMRIVQHDAELWERLLWTSGGLLEFTKSKHFLAIWKFNNNGKPSLMSNEELPQNDMYLKNAAGARTKLV
eukprot:15329561-Ditylum_brightwellii.AAC.1